MGGAGAFEKVAAWRACVEDLQTPIGGGMAFHDDGFRGDGFRGRGFHDRDFGRRRFGFGFGDYYDDYADYNPYGYGYGYYPYRYGYGYPYASSYGYY